MPNGSSKKFKVYHNHMKLWPVQALIHVIQNPEYGYSQITWLLIMLTWNLQKFTKGGYHAFFSLGSKNRFCSNLPQKEKQLLLVSNLKSVLFCGSPFSVRTNFNDAHFRTKKTCQTEAVKNSKSIIIIWHSDQFKPSNTLFKIQNMEILR